MTGQMLSAESVPYTVEKQIAPAFQISIVHLLQTKSREAHHRGRGVWEFKNSADRNFCVSTAEFSRSTAVRTYSYTGIYSQLYYTVSYAESVRNYKGKWTFLYGEHMLCCCSHSDERFADFSSATNVTHQSGKPARFAFERYTVHFLQTTFDLSSTQQKSLVTRASSVQCPVMV